MKKVEETKVIKADQLEIIKEHQVKLNKALTNIGFRRAVVTNGEKPITVSEKHNLISLTPPIVKVTRVTGAGDVFMASHIQAEMVGQKNENAIISALNQTAKYISSSEML